MSEEIKESNNIKAENFKKFLVEKEINVFQEEVLNDELQSVVFRSHIEVGGQNLPTVLIIDNSIYTILRVQIVTGVITKENREAVLDLINKFNSQYKVFKYYITDSGDLCLDCCLSFTEENFDSELVRVIIDVVIQHLVEEYPQIMRAVWADK